MCKQQTANGPNESGKHLKKVFKEFACFYISIVKRLVVADLPRVRIIGHKQSRVRLISKLREITGLKLSKRGYKSIGLSVPDVITTL